MSKKSKAGQRVLASATAGLVLVSTVSTTAVTAFAEDAADASSTKVPNVGGTDAAESEKSAEVKQAVPIGSPEPASGGPTTQEYLLNVDASPEPNSTDNPSTSDKNEATVEGLATVTSTSPQPSGTPAVSHQNESGESYPSPTPTSTTETDADGNTVSTEVTVSDETPDPQPTPSPNPSTEIIDKDGKEIGKKETTVENVQTGTSTQEYTETKEIEGEVYPNGYEESEDGEITPEAIDDTSEETKKLLDDTKNLSGNTDKDALVKSITDMYSGYTAVISDDGKTVTLTKKSISDSPLNTSELGLMLDANLTPVEGKENEYTYTVDGKEYTVTVSDSSKLHTDSVVTVQIEETTTQKTITKDDSETVGDYSNVNKSVEDTSGSEVSVKDVLDNKDKQEVTTYNEGDYAGMLQSFKDKDGNYYVLSYSTGDDGTKVTGADLAELMGDEYYYDSASEAIYKKAGDTADTTKDTKINVTGSSVAKTATVKVTKVAPSSTESSVEETLDETKIKELKNEATAYALKKAAGQIGIKDDDILSKIDKDSVAADKASITLSDTLTATKDGTIWKFTDTASNKTYTFDFSEKTTESEGKDLTAEELAKESTTDKVAVSGYSTTTTVTVSTGSYVVEDTASKSTSGTAHAGKNALSNEKDNDAKYSKEKKESGTLFDKAYSVGDIVIINKKNAIVTKVVEVNGVSRIAQVQYAQQNGAELRTIDYKYTVIENGTKNDGKAGNLDSGYEGDGKDKNDNYVSDVSKVVYLINNAGGLKDTDSKDVFQKSNTNFHIETNTTNPLILVDWAATVETKKNEDDADILYTTENIETGGTGSVSAVTKDGTTYYVYTYKDADDKDVEVKLTADDAAKPTKYTGTTSDGKVVELKRAEMSESDIKTAIRKQYSNSDTNASIDGDITIADDGTITYKVKYSDNDNTTGGVKNTIYTVTGKKSDFVTNNITVSGDTVEDSKKNVTGSNANEVLSSLKTSYAAKKEGEKFYIGNTEITDEKQITLALVNQYSYVDYESLSPEELTELLQAKKKASNDAGESQKLENEKVLLGAKYQDTTYYKNNKFTHFEVSVNQSATDADGNVADVAIVDGTVDLKVSKDAETIANGGGTGVALNTTAQLGDGTEGWEYTHKGSNYKADASYRDFYSLKAKVLYDVTDVTYQTKEDAQKAVDKLNEKNEINVLSTDQTYTGAGYTKSTDSNGNVVYKVYEKTGDLTAYGYMTDEDNYCEGSPNNTKTEGGNTYQARGYDLQLKDLTLVNGKVVAQGTTTYYSVPTMLRTAAQQSTASSKVQLTGTTKTEGVETSKSTQYYYAIYGDWKLVSDNAKETKTIDGGIKGEAADNYKAINYLTGGTTTKGEATATVYSGDVNYSYDEAGESITTYSVNSANATIAQKRVIDATATLNHSETSALYKTVTTTKTTTYKSSSTETTPTATPTVKPDTGKEEKPAAPTATPTVKPDTGKEEKPAAPTATPTVKPDTGKEDKPAAPTATPDSGTVTPTATPASGTETAPTATPASGTETAPTATPASGTETTPTATPASGTETAPTATPASGTETTPTATPDSGTVTPVASAAPAATQAPAAPSSADTAADTTPTPVNKTYQPENNTPAKTVTSEEAEQQNLYEHIVEVDVTTLTSEEIAYYCDIGEDGVPLGVKEGYHKLDDGTWIFIEDEATALSDSAVTTGSAAASSAPKTGDISGLWYALNALSAAGLAALGLTGKHSKRKFKH